jgi:hypothetical protein
MGSWSEACGFSGMEIGEGEVAYVMLIAPNKRGSLNDGSFNHYAPQTTLIRGTYNDYGYLRVEDDEQILKIFNEQAKLDLKNGDDFSMDHMNGKEADRWWMHGAAYDFMSSIKQDFPYATDSDEDGKYRLTKANTIGEAQDVWFASVGRRLEAVTTKWAEEEDAILKAMSYMRMTDIFGYDRSVPLNRDKLIDEVVAGTAQSRLDAYRRVTTLGAALFELRKVLCKCESIGPQHGGAEASIQFGKFLLEAQKVRAARWGDEDIEEEE